MRIDPGSGLTDTTKLGGDFYSFRCDFTPPSETIQARDVVHTLDEPSIHSNELRDISPVPDTVDVTSPLEASEVVPFALPVNTDVTASAEQACKIEISMCEGSFCDAFCIVDNLCYNISPTRNDKVDYVWMRHSTYYCYLYE